MTRLRSYAHKLSYWFNWVAGGGLVAMVLLTCSDVVLRSFNRPIPGTFEIVGFLGAMVAAFAIAYTQIMGGHVAIDYLVARLPSRRQALVRSFISLVGSALFVLLAWQSYLYAHSLSLSGEVSPTEKIPLYPFVYAIALACVPVVVVLAVDFARAVREVARK